MNTKSNKIYLSFYMILIIVLIISAPATAQEAKNVVSASVKEPEATTDTISKYLPLSGFYADVRYRFEHVDQDAFTKDATAHTLRTKVGYKTPEIYSFQGLIEIDHVGEIGDENYNNTVNGKGTFPVIADPEGTEINQLWLSFSGIPDTTFKVGRQLVNLDNQRFFGSVGWRQNDQSVDSVVVSNSSISNLSLLYGFIGNVNRINGDDHPAGDLDTETHIAHVSFTPYEWLNLTGYGYWWDVDLIPGISSKTFGGRLTGKVPLAANLKFHYEAELAEQTEHGNNPTNFDATYYHVAPGLTWMGLTLLAGYEVLEGDGTTAFQTPLATLHKFNGWADVFLTTPASGLEDLYGKVSYKFNNFHSWIDGTTITGFYHDFEAENSSMDYGEEWDAQIKIPVTIDSQWAKSAAIVLKYADYEADGFGTDTQKYWAMFQVKF
jgi:hypothetical protein